MPGFEKKHSSLFQEKVPSFGKTLAYFNPQFIQKYATLYCNEQ